MDGKQNHPALKVGQAFISRVQFYGCFNTGLEPKILRSRRLAEAGDVYKFAVGPDLYVQDAVREHLLATFNGGDHSNIWTDGRRTVKFFKDARSAWQYFDGLVDQIKKQNDHDAASVKRLTKQAKAGNVSAALQLGDYGTF